MKVEFDTKKLTDSLRNLHYKNSGFGRAGVLAGFFIGSFFLASLLAHLVAATFGVGMCEGGPIAAYITTILLGGGVGIALATAGL